MVLEKTLESPLNYKEIQPVHSEENQPWDLFGRNDAKAETPILWPPHAKMGSIKDGNGMDLTEGENIKKRWQEYTEELYKKDLHDPDNPRTRHPGMRNQVGLKKHHYEQS